MFLRPPLHPAALIAKQLPVITAWLLQLETVALAQVAKGLQRELEQRAEYAVKFGIPALRKREKT